MKILLSLHLILQDLVMSRVYQSFYGMLDVGDFPWEEKQES